MIFDNWCGAWQDFNGIGFKGEQTLERTSKWIIVKVNGLEPEKGKSNTEKNNNMVLTISYWALGSFSCTTVFETHQQRRTMEQAVKPLKAAAPEMEANFFTNFPMTDMQCSPVV